MVELCEQVQMGVHMHLVCAADVALCRLPSCQDTSLSTAHLSILNATHAMQFLRLSKCCDHAVAAIKS